MDQTPNPAPAPQPAPGPATGPKTSWPALAGLLIVLLLVAGAALYLKERIPAPVDDSTVTELEMQGDSTEPEAIEADLDAQSPDEFDEDFDAAFAEIEASLAE